MKCTECKTDTTVRKTKEVNDSVVKRSRRCPRCEANTTSIELPDHLARSNLRKPQTPPARSPRFQMKCTECKSDTTVRKTKEINDSLIRRHRRCPRCYARTTTIELPEHLARTNLRKQQSTFSRIRGKAQEIIDIVDTSHEPGAA